MAHHIYHTSAIIIDSKNIGEANKQYALFTHELGLIMASAQSVRLLASKLRFNLQQYCLSEVALVRGKNGWKITNAIVVTDYFYRMKDNQLKMEVMVNSGRLLRRLLTGEEKNTALFTIFKNTFHFISTQNLTESQIQNTEYALILSLLHNLGYISSKSEYTPFIGAQEWNQELIEQMGPIKSMVLKEINRGLRESQL